MTITPRHLVLTLVVLISGLCHVLAEHPFIFRDVAKETGLLPAASGIKGHGAAWGDIDQDGWPDLYIATFHYKDSKPNLLFRNREGKFTHEVQPGLRISTRGTGVVFADFDNDGDLDLYTGSMPAPEGSRLAERNGHPFRGNALFRNDKGTFTDVSGNNGACPPVFGGRSATVFDYDGDGLLDILAGEDPIPGYNGSKTKSSRLFRNLGAMRFEDVSRAAGLPEDAAAYGVAAADINGDTWPDLFLASSLGNRLFYNDGKGRMVEAANEVFQWPDMKRDNMVCGVAIADVDQDGRPDIALGQHYDHPWLAPEPNRLYVQRAEKGNLPVFVDITREAGLVPLPLKAPHVEFQDFDNDGRVDLYGSLVKFDAAGRPHPLIYRNLGMRNGLPHFKEFALGVNDFPTAEDRVTGRSGPFYDKMLKDRKIVYFAPGPSGDFDGDGRLDLVLPHWWSTENLLLLRNESPSGNWLEVRVEGGRGVNRMGVGARVEIYPAGSSGKEGAIRLGSREIASGYGYASGQEAVAHFGLGEATACDVVVVLPHAKGTLRRENLKANQRVTVSAAAEE